jgi:hypothetical protein
MSHLEVVDGIVIGPVTPLHVAFFTLAGERIAGGDFVCESEAVAWFHEHYPDQYRQRCEMRCYQEADR